MKRFRLSNGTKTMTIFAWSQKAAEESATFDYLMGEGPIFNTVSVEEALPPVYSQESENWYHQYK